MPNESKLLIPRKKKLEPYPISDVVNGSDLDTCISNSGVIMSCNSGHYFILCGVMFA